jgi:hypothetical protein
MERDSPVSVVERLLSLATLPDPMVAADQIDLPALQIAAANERFQVQRKRIPVLDQRATEAGIDEIRDLDDVVPLLLSHTAYKTYPESFVAKGQWDRMLAWFTTVSSRSAADADVTGVQDVDDWIRRLEGAGHFVFASAGTTGKSSFIDQSAGDVERIADLLTRMWGWPRPVPRDNSRPLFALVPSAGPARLVYAFQAQAKYFARPDATYALTDEPMRIAEINKIMRIQQAMAVGRATPSEVAEFERGLSAKAESMRASYVRLIYALQEHRHEPIIVQGSWPQCWALLEISRELGINGGNFHPDSIFHGGGGTKGLALPADYRELICAYFGQARVYQGYGMSETCTHSPMCESGRFHVPPWLTLLILDESGEQRRYAPEGPVTGRSAYVDPIWEGHWGGTISGDWVTADYGRCDCGRPGPTVEDSVRRAKDVTGVDDEKISCAGSVEAYIRGAIATGVERPERLQ